MKRQQIKRMIQSNPSDAQLRKVITSLQLSADDDFDYSDEQVKLILDQYKPSQTPTQQASTTPQQPINSDEAWGQLAQFRQQTGDASASAVQATQQKAIQNLESFEESANNFYKSIGTRKALIIAAADAMIDQYAVETLTAVNELKDESKNGFQTQVDLVGWINRWTDVTIQPISLNYNPVKGTLEAGK